jgi:hypothetical protein
MIEDFLISEKQISNLLSSILNDIDVKDKINVSENIYSDTKINEWLSNKTITKGGSILIDKFIKNPINNKEKLIERQNINFNILNYQLKILKNYEKDILWILTLKTDIEEDASIKLLFPSTYIINRCNNYRLFLDLYHLYKIIFMPLSCLIYPLSIILTPYYYIYYQMKFKMKFIDYLKVLFQFFKIMFKRTNNLKKDLTKIISFIIYIGVYIYSIYQTFLISYIIYKTRDKLLIKLKGLVDFIKTSITIIKKANNSWKPFFIYNDDISELPNILKKLGELNYDLSSIYKLWQNPKFKNYIILILKIIYTIDIINTYSNLKRNKNWCLPTFTDKETRIWDIRNPLLENQKANQVSLNKNLIITGVNAGGKTTYVKAIASNIILAQTLGIINGLKGEIMIYDAIISFMRISDEVGVQSYFEAETNCCSRMVKIADELEKNNKRGIFLLDEPMHSTPPIEGMSVAYAFAMYLSKLRNIRVIITTHFHKLIELEDNYKDRFINLSVMAFKEDNNYKFDYKINRGGSRQTIAIELLKKHELNDEIINSAIEIKNKICNETLRNDF